MMTWIFVDSFFNSLIHFYRKWGCWAMQAWMANNIIFKQLQKNIVFLKSKMISKVAKLQFSNDMKCQDLLNRL